MTVTFFKSVPDVSMIPEGAKTHIAFVGRSNVGKSSLLNDLASTKQLARVSSEPGRTQLINLFDVDKRYYLVDLPGYGFANTTKAKRERFSDMVRDYLWNAQNLKLVVVVIDARIGPTDLDREMFEYLTSGKIPFVIVVNKIDKLSRNEANQLMRELDTQNHGVALFPHSSVTSLGKGEILHAIHQAVSA